MNKNSSLISAFAALVMVASSCGAWASDVSYKTLRGILSDGRQVILTYQSDKNGGGDWASIKIGEVELYGKRDLGSFKASTFSKSLGAPAIIREFSVMYSPTNTGPVCTSNGPDYALVSTRTASDGNYFSSDTVSECVRLK